MAVKAHRRDPSGSPLGARVYKSIRLDHPKGERVRFPAGAEDEFVREILAKVVDQCGGAIMKKRPEFIDVLMQLDSATLNTTEMNAILDIFTRINPKNQRS